MARSDLEHRAEQRGRYIAATTDLRAVEAEAVAYSELGFSTAGIATQMDSTATTVSGYLTRAVAQYGPEIAYARRDFEPQRDFEEVGAEDITSWPPHYRETWREAVERHPDHAPDVATPDLSDGVTAP